MGYVLNRGTKDRPSWYCKFRDLDGKWKQKATKQTTKAAALRFAAEIEARVARGQAGIVELSSDELDRRAITVGELGERFLNEYSRPSLRSLKNYRTQVAAVFNQRLKGYPLAAMPAVSVRRIHVEAHRDALTRDGYKPATVNDALDRLSLVYNWAIDRELIEGKNPCRKVERMPAPPSEECYSREQVYRLLATGDAMVAAALYTGMRRGELAGLRWDCVDFDRGCITVRRSFNGLPQNGKTRIVPIHRELLPILHGWRDRCPPTPQDLVFPADVRGAWQMHSWPTLARVRKLLITAGCPHDLDRPWHAMRRAFATLFCDAGGARDALVDILGHTATGNKVTSRYVLPSLANLARELDKLSLQPTAPAKVFTMASYRQQAS